MRMRTWSTQQNRKEVKGYLLYKQEVYSMRVSLHFVGENVFCFDMACPEAETLFVFLYYVPHFQNGPAKVYLPKGDADRNSS